MLNFGSQIIYKQRMISWQLLMIAAICAAAAGVATPWKTAEADMVFPMQLCVRHLQILQAVAATFAQQTCIMHMQHRVHTKAQSVCQCAQMCHRTWQSSAPAPWPEHSCPSACAESERGTCWQRHKEVLRVVQAYHIMALPIPTPIQASFKL